MKSNNKYHPEVSLKEFIEARISALEKATTVTAALMEKRLESMNEFRGQLKDQAQTFLPRTEYSIQYDKLFDDIRVLRDSKSLLEGKASQLSTNIAMLIAIIGLIISLITLLRSVDGNNNNKSNFSGPVPITSTMK